MKDIFVKIKVFIVLLAAFIFTMPVVNAGTILWPPGWQGTTVTEPEANMGFRMWNCTKFIEDSEYDMPTSADDIAQMCYYLGIEGNAISSYEVEYGGKVDPGDYVLLATTWDPLNDHGKTTAVINYTVFFDYDSMTFIRNSSTGDGYFFHWVDEYTTCRASAWGQYHQGYTWNHAYANTKQDQSGEWVFTGLIDDATSDCRALMKQKQNMIYQVLQVNEDTTPGKTLYFNYGSQQVYCDAATDYIDADTDVRVFLSADNFMFEVSGGETSTDASLKSLTTSNMGDTYPFAASTPFVAGSTDYTTFRVNVPNSITSIDIEAVANKTDSFVTIGTTNSLSKASTDTNVGTSENNPLSVGANTFYVLVTAASGTTQYYTITVYRLSNDTSIQNMSATGITLTSSTDQSGNVTYSGSVGYDTTSTFISATPTNSNAQVPAGQGTWDFGTDYGTLTRQVIVQAEDCATQYLSLKNNTCTSQTYTVSISRTAPSGNSKLSNLTVNNAAITGFNSDILTYNYGTVGSSVTSLRIGATVADTGKAVVSDMKVNNVSVNYTKDDSTGVYAIPSANLNVGANSIVITVKAEDGSTSNYTLNINRKSADTALTSFTITSNPQGTLSPAFNSTFTGQYTYTYDPMVTSIKVDANVHDTGKAKVVILDATDGVPATYTTKLNRDTQTFTTPDTTDVVIIVVAEDDTTQIYPIKFTRQASANNYLSGLKVIYGPSDTVATMNPTFSSTTERYQAEIPAEITTATIVPTKAVQFSSVIQIGDTVGTDLESATVSGLEFGENQYEIIVKSEGTDGVQKKYYLTLNRAKYNINTLEDLKVGGTTVPNFSQYTHNYTYATTLPHNQSTLTISGEKTNEYASVSVTVEDANGDETTETITESTTDNTFSGTVNIPTGASKIKVLVTAHNGDERTYIVNVNRTKNNDTSISSIIVDGQTATPTKNTDGTYSVEVINSKKTLQPAEVGVGIPSDATLEKGPAVTDLSTTVAKDFKFTVVAEDGTEEEYTLHVIRKKNDVAEMTRATLSIPSTTYNRYCLFENGATTCEIDAPVETTNFTLATILSDGATVNPVDGVVHSMSPSESTKSVPLTVTSEDGTDSKVYTVTVVRAKSSDNTLSDLAVDGDTVRNFSPSTNNYTYTLAGTHATATITATVNDSGKATVTKITKNSVDVTANGSFANDVFTLPNESLNFGNNTFVITVQAENDQTTNYTLVVVRSLNVDPALADIKVGIMDLTPTTIPNFNEAATTYTLANTSFQNTQMTVVAYPKDPYGAAVIMSVVDEEGNTTQTAIPDNNTTDGTTYSAVVNLSTGENTITIRSYAHDTSVTRNYIIKITREKNSSSDIENLKVHGVTAEKQNDGTYSVTLPNNITVVNPTDVTFDPPSGSTVSVTQVLPLSTQETNVYQFTVTSESGAVTTYTVNIEREKSNDTAISGITLRFGTNDIRECVLSSTTTSCRFPVPAETTNFTLTANGDIITDGIATIKEGNPSSYTMGVSESTKDITLTVVAEDGTEEEYQVTVVRAASNNAYLKTITADGVQVRDFAKGRTSYYIEINGDVTNRVVIDAQVEDTGKAKINSPTLPFRQALDFGQNQVVIEVEAEDGSTLEYTVNVYRTYKTDATLAYIRIDGQDIPGFDPEVFEYTLADQYYTTTSIRLESEVNDLEGPATKSGHDGDIGLTTGLNELKITVLAHDRETSNEYVIKLTRKKNNDTRLDSIIVAGVEATCNNVTKKCTVSVPNEVKEVNHDNTEVNPMPGQLDTDPLADVDFDDTPLTKAETSIPITVTAEDGTVATYTLEVTREKSKIATLSELTVTDGSFNPSFVPDDATKIEYTITIPVDAKEFDIEATPTDSQSRITSGIGHYTITQSDMDINVVVQSEDLSVLTTYKLHIKRTKSSDNTLKELSVTSGDVTNLTIYPIVETTSGDEGFDPSKNSYTINVPGDVESVDIAAVLNDDRATITNADDVLGEKTLRVGNNTISIRVESESGAGNVYTLNIIRAQKPYNKLATLTVDGVSVPGFNPDITSYTLDDVPNSKASVVIAATAEDDSATISGTGTRNLNTGDNALVVNVTAQDGTEKVYTINVMRERSSNALLSILSVNGAQSMTPTFDKDTNEYTVVVDSTQTTLKPDDVVVRAQDAKAIVSKDPELTLSTTDTNTYKVTVVAEDGTPNVYTLNIVRPESSDATIKSVTIQDGVGNITPLFDKNKYEYTLTVPYGTTTFVVNAVPTVDTTVITGTGTHNSSESTITLVGYAENGNTQVYRFNVVVAQSNDDSLADLSVTGYPFLEPNDVFESPVYTYDIGDLDFSVTGLEINATPTNPNAKAVEYYVNGVKQTNNIVEIPQTEGVGTITVRVTAADGITHNKIYSIRYNKTYSTNNYLAYLRPNVGTLNFLKTNIGPYVLNVTTDVTSVTLTMWTESVLANVQINGEAKVSATEANPYIYTISDLATGDNPVTIVVSAQDNSTRSYSLVIRRAGETANQDASLQDLNVDNYPFKEEGSYPKDFSKNQTNYTIGSIPYSLDKIKVNADPTQSTSTVSYLVNGKEVTPDSNGYIELPKEETNDGIITVKVTAEDPSVVRDYTIHYSKKASDDVFLSDLVVSQGELTPAFDKETLEYVVELDDDVTSNTVTATLENNSSQLFMNGVEYPSPNSLTITNIGEGDTPVIILVTAEDGTTMTYKVIFRKSTADEKITSINYGHTIQDGMILTVTDNTKVSDMKDQLDNENSKLEIWDASESNKLGDNDLVGTGMVVKLIIDGVEKDRDLIVIVGDTTGDGEINVLDIGAIVDHILGVTTLTGPYERAAQATKGDTDIDVLDVGAVTDHILAFSSLFD